MGEVAKITEDNPLQAKMRLAKEVVVLLVGEEAAGDAEKSWAQTFQKGELPENIREVKIESGREVREVLMQEGLVTSRSDFQRLAKEGAIEFDGTKVKDLKTKIDKSGVLKIDK